MCECRIAFFGAHLLINRSWPGPSFFSADSIVNTNKTESYTSLYNLDLFCRSGAIWFYTAFTDFDPGRSEIFPESNLLSVYIPDALIATIMPNFFCTGDTWRFQSKAVRWSLLARYFKSCQVGWSKLLASLLSTGHIKIYTLHHAQVTWKIKAKVCWPQREMQPLSPTLSLLEKSTSKSKMSGWDTIYGHNW